MATWFYQLNNKDWSVNNYRLDVWEGARWEWSVGRAVGILENPPVPGDKIVFFYVPAGCDEPGFYGQAVITQWIDEVRNGERERRFYFLPVAPSDRLKMHPWCDPDVTRIVDEIRGRVPMGNVWPVTQELAKQIGSGINSWVSGSARPNP